MNIAFLASGNLGLKTIFSLSAFIKPFLIATDKHSYGIIEFSKNSNVPLFIGNPRDGRLAGFMRDFKIDILLSINYLFLINSDVIEQVNYAVNLHGSLLPKYRGRTPHVWAIINNEKYTGITAHLIDQGCDTGNIIMQKSMRISDMDTGADLLKKFEDLYPQMVKELIETIRRGDLAICKQDHSRATYFPKRTPEEGQINWDWQKERIHNWVRALAYPYPGAFSFLEGQKIIIHSVSYSDHGFSHSDPNGLILDCNTDPIVKSPNGAVILKSFRSEPALIFITGKILT